MDGQKKTEAGCQAVGVGSGRRRSAAFYMRESIFLTFYSEIEDVKRGEKKAAVSFPRD